VLATGTFSRLAAPALVFCWLVQPAAADGLSRFEEAVKTGGLPKGALTYKSAKPLGEDGFVLDDVVVTPPEEATGAKTEPVPIKRITVETFDFAAIDKNLPPHFVKMHAEGILLGAQPVEGVDLKQLAGVDKVAADFQVDYRLDPEHKTMTLKELGLDLIGLARIDFAMTLDGVAANAVDDPDAMMKDANLRSASLVYEDHSLLGKAVPAAAKTQGIEPAALVAMGKGMLAGLRAGQGMATLAVLDAIASFIDDYKQPKGQLRITLDPPGKTSAAAISAMKNPDEAIKALGLAVSYAGTKPQPTPADSPAPAQRPAK
jgi:hypothetical protein